MKNSFLIKALSAMLLFSSLNTFTMDESAGWKKNSELIATPQDERIHKK